MTKPMQALSLAELTITALVDHDNRFDWDWVICYHIRQWEARNVRQYELVGKKLVNNHFAWYHCHEICDRVLAKAEDNIQVARKAVDLGGDELSAYAKYLIFDLLYPECEREFLKLASALDEHRLSLYQ